MEFISSKGLEELKKYQYKSGGYSWLDNKLNPFWLACVECVPLTIAPNLLTFIGFLFMLASCVIQVSYDHTLTESLPSWTFLFSALSIFIYQTLDAIDGKQARRTGSSSPLGQLFDHGCDSFSLTFFLLGIAQAAKIEKEYFFFIFLGNQILLWGANQNEHYTGVMHTHFMNFGVTESELLCVFIHLVSFFFGQDSWHLSMSDTLPIQLTQFIPGIVKATPFHLFIIFSLIPTYFGLGFYILVSNVKNAVNPKRVFLEWVPLFAIWWLGTIYIVSIYLQSLSGSIQVSMESQLDLFQSYLAFFSLKQFARLLFVQPQRQDLFPLFHFEVIPYFITSFVIFLDPAEEIKIGVFWLTLGVTVFLVFRFVSSVVNQITKFLGIYCFSLKRRS